MAFEKISEIQIDQSTEDKIKNNSPDKLPLNPTLQGWSGQAIRSFLAKALIGTDGSLLSTMKAKLSILKALFEETETSINEIKALWDGYIQNGDTNLEVIAARGGFPSLNDRLLPLDELSSIEAQKAEINKQYGGEALNRTPKVEIYTMDVPNLGQTQIIPVWTNGIVSYGVDSEAHGKVFKSSTWRGAWVQLSGVLPDNGAKCRLIRLNTGTLIAWQTGKGVWRSADDGITWTQVFTFSASTINIMNSGITETINGYVLFGEYDNATLGTDKHIYLSMDDGVTWNSVLTVPSPAGTLVHCHYVRFDYKNNNIVAFFDGENGQPMKLYVSTNNGVSFTKIAEWGAGIALRPNSVDLMFFENYIAWGTDGSDQGWVQRCSRIDFYNGDFSMVENCNRIVTGAMYWCERLASDKYIMSTSNTQFAEYRGGDKGVSYIVYDEGLGLSEAFSTQGKAGENITHMFARQPINSYSAKNFASGLGMYYPAFPIELLIMGSGREPIPFGIAPYVKGASGRVKETYYTNNTKFYCMHIVGLKVQCNAGATANYCLTTNNPSLTFPTAGFVNGSTGSFTIDITLTAIVPPGSAVKITELVAATTLTMGYWREIYFAPFAGNGSMFG